MDPFNLNRRQLLVAAATTAAALSFLDRATALADNPTHTETSMTSHTFTKTAPPAWLLAFWKEVDDKTWGKGFDCFAPNAIANLGVSDWHGREAIREKTSAPLSTRGLRPIMRSSNSGTADFSRCFVDSSP
jgi:hypothetical protein